MPYDELVKRLKIVAQWADQGLLIPPSICLEAADAIEELRKAVLRLEDESGIYDELPTFYIYPTKWIPVTERLPEQSGKYRAFALGEENTMDFYDKHWMLCGTDYSRYVTHWMPCQEPPEPPKEET